MRKKRIMMAGLAGALGTLIGVAAWLIPGVRRATPADRERRRRLYVNARGRTGNATIFDFHDGVVCYNYWIGGVKYTASQEVTTLLELLPPDPGTLIANPATLKYLARNPANSIVVCEEWTGLRFRPLGNGGSQRPPEPVEMEARPGSAA
jgi:hypothetical protein